MYPFAYPETAHTRQHGPAGYANYKRYRQWLRDEFIFRCVYCLKREQWDVLTGVFHIDHVVPQAEYPAGALDYDNLVYSCVSCNLAKGSVAIPNPCDSMLHGHVVVKVDGSIEAATREAWKVIRVLGLDDPEYQEYRCMMIGIVQMAASGDETILRRLLKYPGDLPNLAALRPRINTRPGGVQNSHYARRQRGELPELY